MPCLAESLSFHIVFARALLFQFFYFLRFGALGNTKKASAMDGDPRPRCPRRRPRRCPRRCPRPPRCTSSRPACLGSHPRGPLNPTPTLPRLARAVHTFNPSAGRAAAQSRCCPLFGTSGARDTHTHAHNGLPPESCQVVHGEDVHNDRPRCAPLRAPRGRDDGQQDEQNALLR